MRQLSEQIRSRTRIRLRRAREDNAGPIAIVNPRAEFLASGSASRFPAARVVNTGMPGK